jgi:hypothetical protein
MGVSGSFSAISCVLSGSFVALLGSAIFQKFKYIIPG